MNYYVSPNNGRGFKSSQTGMVEDPFLGSCGLLKAISSGIVAGDKILVQGSGTIDNAALCYDGRYVITATTPNKTATWFPGDFLQPSGGAVNWSGCLYSITATTQVIGLDKGDYTAFTILSGIYNITRDDSSTCTAKARTNIVSKAAGTLAGGYISIIGCNTDWNEKSGYFKCLDDESTTDQTALISLTHAYIYIYGMFAQGGTTRVFYLGGGWTYLENCYGNRTVTGGGQGAIYLGTYDNVLTGCVFNGNAGNHTAALVYCDDVRSTFINCKIINSNYTGIGLNGISNKIIDCLIYNSKRENVRIAASNNTVIGCILDKTGAGYSNIYSTAAYDQVVMFNRITNAATYGIEAASAFLGGFIEDYNIFDSNTSGPRLNINAGPHSQTVTDTNQGYADANYATSRDYRLSETATGRRQEVNYNWDSGVVGNLFYPSVGLSPTDIPSTGGAGIILPRLLTQGF